MLRNHFAEWQYASARNLVLRILAGEVLHPQFFFRCGMGIFTRGVRYLANVRRLRFRRFERLCADVCSGVWTVSGGAGETGVLSAGNLWAEQSLPSRERWQESS